MSKKGVWAATFSILLFFATGVASRSAAEWTIQGSDETNRDLKYATNASGSWQIQTVDSAGKVGLDTSITLDGSGKAHNQLSRLHEPRPEVCDQITP